MTIHPPAVPPWGEVEIRS